MRHLASPRSSSSNVGASFQGHSFPDPAGTILERGMDARSSQTLIALGIRDEEEMPII
jgi:hypothetical protein